MSIIVYGASDDLIEVEGDVSDEFNVYAEDDSSRWWLATDAGHLVEVCYDEDGRWKLLVLCGESVRLHEAVDAEGGDVDGRPGYSDHYELRGDVRHVVLGTHHTRRETPDA